MFGVSDNVDSGAEKRERVRILLATKVLAVSRSAW
jgi:hypothetical protein